jgi:hypothetical protein
MAALMKPSGATRPCLHQGECCLRGAASQCATAPSSSLMRCASDSAGLASLPSISSPAAHGRTAISKASMPVCEMNCSTAKSSTALRRCGSSPAGGAIITTEHGPTAVSDIDHRPRRRSRCQPGRSAPLRSASRPGWYQRRRSTNYTTGPVIAGSPCPELGPSRCCDMALPLPGAEGKRPPPD